MPDRVRLQPLGLITSAAVDAFLGAVYAGSDGSTSAEAGACEGDCGEHVDGGDARQRRGDALVGVSRG